MFDKLRESIENLVNGAGSPEERRAAVGRMKETLVQARLGIEDLRGGVAQTRARLAAEREALTTVRRRRVLAEGIGDRETVAVAERYERHHAERLQALEHKFAAQEEEVAVAEREVAEMTAELRAAVHARAAGGAATGRPAAAAAAEAEVAEALGEDAAVRDELDALARGRRRAERDAAAEERLAALKRRMGK